MFWIIYLVLSALLVYLISRLFKNNLLKIIIFNIFLSLFMGIWFISPGSDEIAPIFSILLLEASIVDDNGITRLLRPWFALFLFSLTASIIYWISNSKN
tara:strand:+ start:561 stop:857 length:297 start_codon:yes stop_codon:yes gene_type:complete